MDNLLWRADLSTCTINGDVRTYPSCMESDCFACKQAIRDSPTDAALQELDSRTQHLEVEADSKGKSKRKKAVEFLAAVLKASQEQHPDNLQATIKAILDLAYYENPFSQMFVDENNGSSHNTDMCARMQGFE